MKLDLKFKPIFIDGKEVGEKTVAKIFAESLANTRSSDALRAMCLATKIYENECVDVELSDLRFLEECTRTLQMNNFVLLPVLEAIEKAKSSSK